MATTYYNGIGDTVADIRRALGQYRATRTTPMSQYNLTAMYKGALQANASEATKRAALAQQQENSDRQYRLQLKQQKLAEEAQDAQALAGWIGTGYKLAGGQKGLETIGGKIKNWFSSPEVPSAYNPSALSASAFQDQSLQAMAAETGISEDTLRSLMLSESGDGLVGMSAIADTAGTDLTSAFSGDVGDEFLSGGSAAADTVSSLGGDVSSGVAGGGISTLADSGSGIASVADYTSGLDSFAKDSAAGLGAELGISSGGAESLLSGGGDSALSGGLPTGVGSGIFSAGASAVGDLLAGKDINIGKAVTTGAGAGLGTAAGLALAGGNPIGGVVGSIVGSTVIQPVVSAVSGLFGGGGSVLCTELHRQGLLDKEVYELDSAYGAQADSEVLAGYHAWGIPVARRMRRSALLTSIARPFIVSWAYTMAARMRPDKYKPRPLGRVLEWFGVPLCRLIGRRVMRRATAAFAAQEG